MAAGLMLRDTLDANSVRFSLEAMTQGNGGFAIRAEAGRPVQRMPVPMDLPIWLRLTRYGAGVFAATSSDGKVWDLVGQNMLWQNNPNLPASSWIGLFASSRKGLGKVVVDQVSFTPTPSAAQVLPPGALLRSGSFLAGAFEYMGFDPANPDAYGRFNRSGKFVAIPRSKIAAVTMLPTARNQIAEMGSHIGLLMKNGDVMDGDFDSIGGNGVRITSVLLGMTAYNRSEVRACFLHPAQAQPATYEIRLRDGSIVKASGISSNNGVINIEEVSGVSVPISPDEIVQFRAGSSRVQSLDELDWKATQPPVAPVANTAPLTNTAPAVNGVPDQLPSVRCWEGKNQEQIMEAPVGTTLDFPLPGRFRVMCARIAVSPDSPPNSQVTLRILADGKEIGRTPPLRAGEQPRLMKVTIQDPKTVTIESDSIFVDSKVLLIDPVAVRDN